MNGVPPRPYSGGGGAAGEGAPGSMPSPAVPIPNGQPALGVSGSLAGANYEPAQPHHRSGSGGANSPEELRAAASALVGGAPPMPPSGHRTGSRPSTPTASLEMQVRLGGSGTGRGSRSTRGMGLPRLNIWDATLGFTCR
jgi:hypothetical protein